MLVRMELTTEKIFWTILQYFSLLLTLFTNRPKQLEKLATDKH